MAMKMYLEAFGDCRKHDSSAKKNAKWASSRLRRRGWNPADELSLYDEKDFRQQMEEEDQIDRERN